MRRYIRSSYRQVGLRLHVEFTLVLRFVLQRRNDGHYYGVVTNSPWIQR